MPRVPVAPAQTELPEIKPSELSSCQDISSTGRNFASVSASDPLPLQSWMEEKQTDPFDPERGARRNTSFCSLSNEKENSRKKMDVKEGLPFAKGCGMTVVLIAIWGLIACIFLLVGFVVRVVDLEGPFDHNQPFQVAVAGCDVTILNGPSSIVKLRGSRFHQGSIGKHDLVYDSVGKYVTAVTAESASCANQPLLRCDDICMVTIFVPPLTSGVKGGIFVTQSSEDTSPFVVVQARGSAGSNVDLRAHKITLRGDSLTAEFRHVQLNSFSAIVVAGSVLLDSVS